MKNEESERERGRERNTNLLSFVNIFLVLIILMTYHVLHSLWIILKADEHYTINWQRDEIFWATESALSTLLHYHFNRFGFCLSKILLYPSILHHWVLEVLLNFEFLKFFLQHTPFGLWCLTWTAILRFLNLTRDVQSTNVKIIWIFLLKI